MNKKKKEPAADRIPEATEQTKNIGILSDELHYNIPVTILRAVKQTLASRQLKFLYFGAKPFQTPYNFNSQSNILYDLISNQTVSGLLVVSNLIGVFAEHEVFLKKINQYADLPVVSLGTVLEGIPSVIVDNRKGMYNAVRHLIEEHKYRRLAFIGGPEQNVEAIERFEAYIQALRDYNIPFDPALRLPGDFQGESARVAIEEMINHRGLIPGKDVDALVCCNDYMAVAAMLDLQSRGYKVPEDIAVVGFDDIAHVSSLSPPLSSIRQPFNEMTIKAVDCLQDLMENREAPLVTRIPSEFINRHSCGCKQIFDYKQKIAAPENSQNQVLLTPEKKLEIINREIYKSNGTYIQLWENGLELLNDLDNWKKHELSGEGIKDFTKTAWEVLWRTARDSITLSNYEYQTQSIGIQLNSTLDLEEVLKILTRKLPLVGVNKCYICIYENPEAIPEGHSIPPWSHLILGLTDEGRIPLPSEGIRFPTREILPQEILQKDGWDDWVIAALYYQEEQMGFILMDSQAPNPNIYYHFRTQLSGSLKGVLLLRGYHDRSQKLAKANAQIKEFNEQLKSENLRIRAEMEVARNIQEAILPKGIDRIHPDFKISAKMLPAEEVGGDYYDVALDKAGALWLGIGDVSGHGLTPGLIMMLAQTVHTTLTTNMNTTPAEALDMMNKVMIKNVMQRMNKNHYMTCTLLKYHGSGRFEYSGMHMDLLIYRKKEKKCELLPSDGLWLNMIEDISQHNKNASFRLETDDTLILYTDGIIEATNSRKVMLELQGLQNLILRYGDMPLDDMRDSILHAARQWNGNRNIDDMTLLLVRRI